MTAPATELRLGIAARAENLALVRQALAGLGDAVELDDAALADLKQIATEACMNAVVHAYPPGEEGPIDVTARAENGMVELRVRDWGVGFRPRPADAEGSLRLGLPLIATMADSFEIATPPDGGTAMVARLHLSETKAEPDRERPETPSEAELAITAGASARPVIARVLALAGARAGFTLDRMSDGVLLGDAIAAGAVGDFAENRVGIGLDECGPNLCVRVGPLVPGGGKRLMDRMELPGLGVSVSKLANRVEVESADDGEYLVVELAPEPDPAGAERQEA